MRQIFGLLERYHASVGEGGGLYLTEFEKLLRLSGATNLSSDFISKVFTWVDQDGTGAIDFRELVYLLSIMAHGSDEDKLFMVFAIYDTNRSGFLEPDAMQSLVDSMRTSVVPMGSQIRLRMQQLSAAREPHGISRVDFMNSAPVEILLKSLGFDSVIALPEHEASGYSCGLFQCANDSPGPYSTREASLSESEQRQMVQRYGFLACSA